MNTPEATQQLARMISGYWISQAVYVAAKLKIADLLAQRPQSLSELAAATKTHEPSLYRLLRALASVGIFAEEADRRLFSHRWLSVCEVMFPDHSGRWQS